MVRRFFGGIWQVCWKALIKTYIKANKIQQNHIRTYQNEDFDRVIIMDADGEDKPEELDLFFKKSEENPDMTITGNRFKRSEGLIFKILYEIHKILTLIFLT